MRKLALLLFMSCPASAAGLIGTTTSFPSSAFCQTYKCEHFETLPLTSETKLYSYAIPGDPMPSTIRVVRNGQKIAGAGYRTGGSDWVFSNPSSGNRELADLIGAVTGVRPTANWVNEMKCKHVSDGIALNTYKAGGKTFTVACVTNPGGNFVYFDVSIY